MKLANEQVSKSAQSWINRVARRYRPKVDYSFELSGWVQHVMLEAEKNKDLEKKEQFLGLLKDLDVI
jgi:hypothetical protein